jgi:hypothetical protein
MSVADSCRLTTAGAPAKSTKLSSIDFVTTEPIPTKVPSAVPDPGVKRDDDPM